MRTMLEEGAECCDTLDEVLASTKEVFAEFVEDGYEIGYIAGPISADGEENISRNLQRLLDHRRQLMREVGSAGVRIFTAPIIFTPFAYNRLGLFRLDPAERESRLQQFWDAVVTSGLVHHIYFAPGWQRSQGTRREHATALASGVAVHYIGEENDRI